MRRTTPSIPAVYIRGGTSKALFLHAKDVPSPGPARDRFLLRIMGSPDPMQIDGIGGTHIVTSKVAIIAPSDREDIDVDYTFCQIGINEASVDYSANCGNISSGVGVFAIQEGLIREFREGVGLDSAGSSDGQETKKIKTQEVRIFNTGTRKVLVSHVAVDEEDGMPLEDEGGFEIAGCPGFAAPILMDYRNVIGASQNKGALPTHSPTNTVTLTVPTPSSSSSSLSSTTTTNKEDSPTEISTEVQYSVVDIANLIIFVRSSFLTPLLKFTNSDIEIKCTEPSSILTSNTTLIQLIKQIRGKVAVDLGLCKDWRRVDEGVGMIPMVCLVAPPSYSSTPDESKAGGKEEERADIQARIFLDNKCHSSMAGTGAICLTGASRISGTIVADLIKEGSAGEGEKRGQETFRIGHPLGVMPVVVELFPSLTASGSKLGVKNEETDEREEETRFKTLSFIRTARRIWDGNVYVPRNVRDTLSSIPGPSSPAQN